ncbi:hypothetical protein [Shewanella surugensis]|uniref:Phage protein n=1 Tax=Shewanella surugensis TaxID=212020 RepID=A0ABT0LGD9_9GAMM|nr:hypothetical protein [Shewanella surugensis]MCL1126725.1 hypothetical protein [Shewanella surugensis]
MSARKIKSALTKKNIPVERVEYVRGCPTPSGYANGWDIDISEETVEQIYMKDEVASPEQNNEFDTLSDVLDWVESLPAL